MSNKKPTLILPTRQIEGLSWGQTTRQGGVSSAPYTSFNLANHVGDSPLALRQNWELLQQITPWSRASIATCSQVHGDKIIFSETGGHLDQQADALISLHPGTAVGVFTADCVPILLADPITRVVAAIHCGWKGAALRLASKTLHQLVSQVGVLPENVLVWFGASIAQCSYQVGAEVIASFGESPTKTSQPPLKDPRSKIDPDGKYLLDIAGVVEDELLDAGILPSNIEHAGIDTFQHSTLVYSYRAEGGKTGRMLSFVGFR